MDKKDQKIRDQVVDEVYYGIPQDHVRKKMSPRELAKLLSEQKKGSPGFIFIQHELNIRLLRLQTRSGALNAIIGLLGIILGWLLGQWRPFGAAP